MTLRHPLLAHSLAAGFLLNSLCAFGPRRTGPAQPCGPREGCLLVETADGDDSGSLLDPHCLFCEPSHPYAPDTRSQAGPDSRSSWEEVPPGPGRSRSPPAR